MISTHTKHILLVVILGLLLINSCKIKRTKEFINTETEQIPVYNSETKPWTRWWWHGNAVTKDGITYELEELTKKGFGGVELTPIYGVRGEENQQVEFLDDQWIDYFKHTLMEAKRLGLGVDLATGTGWPFGGPWVSETDAPKYLTLKRFIVKKGEQFNQNINLMQEPVFRTVRPTGLSIENIKYPITANADLQELAIDQIRYKIPLTIKTILAFQNGVLKEEITSKSDNEGNITYSCENGDCEIFVAYEGNHGKMVERAAPGGEGNVIDHFSASAVTKYLDKFNRAFSHINIGYLRAFFNDSYEVDDAFGQANWTPDFFNEFKQRRGYDLKEVMPALYGSDTEDNNLRVLCDYRETVSDLMLYNFTKKWNSWVIAKGKITRNQSHGSPANILDLYAASAIPETEGTDVIKIKMASSPANISGKKLIAAEAATWLGEHFTANLSDLKENTDRYFTGGVNHVVYHGTCYSPKNDPWPGRLFYASYHANQRNPEWENFDDFNSYVTKVQSFLQNGTTLNEVLLYFPVYDRFSAPKKELLDHFDGMAYSRGGTSRVREIAETLYNDGYSFDFISDLQIQELDKKLLDYKVIIIPQTTFFHLKTLEKLNDLANKGYKIIFDRSLPNTVNGLYKKDERTFQFDNLKKLVAQNNNVKISNHYPYALDEFGIKPEQIKKTGVDFIRKINDGKIGYFISNWSEKAIDQWIKFEYVPNNAVVYHPMSGEKYIPSMKGEKVRIQLNKGESIILFKEQKPEAKLKNLNYDISNRPSLILDQSWELSFIKGGNSEGVLPANISLRGKPVFWTALSNKDCDCFSGSARYKTQFQKPEVSSQYWLLDLGEVKESAKVFLNGQKIATSFGPVHHVKIKNVHLKTQNTLIIEVSNSMANRIICLEKKGIKWQKFYNINMSAKESKNLNKDRIFSVIDWKPLPSGINGPVTLSKIK
jgi:hypothetical protein